MLDAPLIDHCCVKFDFMGFRCITLLFLFTLCGHYLLIHWTNCYKGPLDLNLIMSVLGKEHFYDIQSGSGFLAWRLKTIQRKTKLVSQEPKMTAGCGGPRKERELPQTGGQLDEERCKEIISLMNHTSDREIILQKMKETFEYRQRLIHNPDESHNILSVFPRLLDTKGLVSI